jgi:transposase-like protein
MEVLPEAYWQRCYVHFLRNALDYLPRKGGDDVSLSCDGFTSGATPPKPAEI